MLSGVRVLDLTRMLAGPYGSMLLADMGAEVIKVESPRSGDPIRHMGPPFIEGESAYFLGINRNKRSVTLDLSQAPGRELFLELVELSDVVLDNFRPGVMARLGLGPDDLSAAKPSIISCSISAFGSSGPYVDLPAFDLILQALGGGMSLTGPSDGEPVRMGLPIGDLGGGLFACQAICGALFHRERTGEGQHIDLALLDIQVSMLTYLAQYHFADGRVPGTSGTGHQSVVPYQAFDTADSPIVIAVFVDRFWEALCDVLDLPDFKGRYPTAPLRLANRDTVVSGIAARFKTDHAAAWIERLWAAGVPSAPVQTVDQVLADPQVQHRNMVVQTTAHPIVGPYLTLGDPIKTASGESTFTAAPTLGQSNEEIFGGLLGRSDDEIRRLTDLGVL